MNVTVLFEEVLFVYVLFLFNVLHQVCILGIPVDHLPKAVECFSSYFLHNSPTVLRHLHGCPSCFPSTACFFVLMYFCSLCQRFRWTGCQRSRLVFFYLVAFLGVNSASRLTFSGSCDNKEQFTQNQYSANSHSILT